MPREKRSRSNERKQSPKPVRKSTRLQEVRRKTPEQNPLLPSPSATKSPGEEACLSYHSLYCMKKTNPMTLSKAPNSSKNEIDHKKPDIHPLRFRNLLRNEYEPQQQAVLLKKIAPRVILTTRLAIQSIIGLRQAAGPKNISDRTQRLFYPGKKDHSLPFKVKTRR